MNPAPTVSGKAYRHTPLHPMKNPLTLPLSLKGRGREEITRRARQCRAPTSIPFKMGGHAGPPLRDEDDEEGGQARLEEGVQATFHGRKVASPLYARKPMRRGLGGGSTGVISSRIASNSDWMCSSWLATLRSSSASLAARSLFVARIFRNRTNALTT